MAVTAARRRMGERAASELTGMQPRSTIMATKASDIRALTVDELDTVSGGAERQYYRFEMFGYGLALQLGDDKCITVITPDEDTIVCL
jgi:hypothetical protein